jgi:hypothetical protein
MPSNHPNDLTAVFLRLFSAAGRRNPALNLHF